MATQTATTSNPIVDTISNLIERCKDGTKGFRTASADVEDADLKHLFMQMATDRDHCITELQDFLHGMGHTASETSSLEGTLHRAWIDLSSALAAKDRKRVLEECERGEDYALSAYRKALSAEGVVGEARTLIEKQYQTVLAAHDKIRDLRNQARAEA